MKTVVYLSEHSNCIKKEMTIALNKNEKIELFFYGKLFGKKHINIEQIVEFLYKKEYEKILYIQGDFSFIVLGKEIAYVYCSGVGSYPLYYYKDEEELVICDDFEKIAKNKHLKISNENLSVLCWGGNCLPYEGIEIFKEDKFFRILSGKIETIYEYRIKREYDNLSFKEYVKIAREIVHNSVNDVITEDKIAVSLSGGVDSSVIAICLKNLGANFECYHWVSDLYSPVDEREQADELCKKNKIKINHIDISRAADKNINYISTDIDYYVPYNHGSFYWWDQTCKLATEQNCKYLFTGLKGDAHFGGFFSLLKLKDLSFKHLLWQMEYFINSFTLPNRQAFKLKKETNQRLDYSILIMRRADFINPKLISALDTINKFDFFYQKESMKFNIFNKYNIYNVNPYANRKLYEFACCIPHYFKSIPVSGQIYTKPILREAFKEELPSSIYTRNYKSNFGMLSQKFCENNKDFILDILGNGVLVGRGIVLPNKLVEVINDKTLLYRNAYTLIRSCFIEIWLKKGEKYV